MLSVHIKSLKRNLQDKSLLQMQVFIDREHLPPFRRHFQKNIAEFFGVLRYFLSLNFHQKHLHQAPFYTNRRGIRKDCSIFRLNIKNFYKIYEIVLACIVSA